MNNTVVHSIVALALAAGAASTHAAEVTLNGWRYGSGNQVQAQGPTGSFNGLAGAFSGSLAGAGSLNTETLMAYGVEVEESFTLGPAAMQGYNVVDGATYFERRHGNGAAIAERLGRLMTFALAVRTFDAVATSTALQLAIWNIVYDTDDSLAAGSGTFHDSSQYQGLASKLSYGINSVRASFYDVFVLESAGSQDFLVLQARAPAVAPLPNGTVPEPGSLALALAALGGIGGIGLRGRRRRAA